MKLVKLEKNLGTTVSRNIAIESIKRCRLFMYIRFRYRDKSKINRAYD